MLSRLFKLMLLMGLLPVAMLAGCNSSLDANVLAKKSPSQTSTTKPEETTSVENTAQSNSGNNGGGSSGGVHTMAVEVLPSNLENNVAINSTNRTVSLTSIFAGQVISLRLFENGAKASGFACNNLPSFSRVQNEFLLVDLSLKAASGTLEFDCSTANGGVTVSIAYVGSLTSIMSASVHGMTSSLSWNFNISPDGKWIAWRGPIITSGNGTSQVMVRNLETQAVSTVSTTNGTTLGNGDSTNPVFSPDSKSIYFNSKAVNFGGHATNIQIFRKSLSQLAAMPQVVSVAADGVTIGNGSSAGFELASDESAIFMTSKATNFGVSGGTKWQIVKKNLTNLATAPVVVSVASDGSSQGGSDSLMPKLSSDGNFLYFYTDSVNLGATGGFKQIVRKSLQNLSTAPVVISVTADGSTIGNGDTTFFNLSYDNSFMVFYTKAANLGATGGVITQIVKKSLTNLSTAPVVLSTASDGTTLGTSDSGPIGVISRDGQFVYFPTQALNLGAANTTDIQIVRKSLVNLASAPVVVSVAADGVTLSNGGNDSVALSPDGKKVYFRSSAPNLIGHNMYYELAIVEKDLTNLAQEPIFMNSQTPSSLRGYESSYEAVFSPDRSFILFTTALANFYNLSGYTQIAKKSLINLSEPIQLVSVTTSNSNYGDSDSQGAVISPDGTFALFATNATNLGATNSVLQIVKKSLVNLQAPPVVVSVTSDGTTIGNGGSYNPVISSDGSFVLFVTSAANLGATGGVNTQIVKKSLTNLATAPVVVSVTSDGTTIANGTNMWPVISADGSFVIFDSLATNMGATGGSPWQVVKKNLLNLATPPQVVSVATNGTTIGNGHSMNASISSDGSFVVFTSFATNLGVTVASNSQIIKKSLSNLATAPVIVSVASDGTTIGNGASQSPRLSSDNSFIVFTSFAANFGANGSIRQIFKKSLTQLASAPQILSTALDGVTLAGGDSGIDSIASDGSAILFESTSITMGVANSWGSSQIFHRVIP